MDGKSVVPPTLRGRAVLMAADEYSGLVETAHLLASPTNARRLMHALSDVEAGNYQSQQLDRS
jgi:antitoxin YefM